MRKEKRLYLTSLDQFDYDLIFIRHSQRNDREITIKSL